jgi:acyl-[acyl-carrier-protein]-phospholipid O-acyltransferase/long-chain-fatty-acid--[acyl-carrier-protein] ligase
MTWWVVLPLLALALVVLAYRFRYLLLVKAPPWIVGHTFYRIRSHGLENIPATGAALLVCNHVSQLDAGILVSQVRRPIRFLIYSGWMTSFPLKYFFRTAKVIPINPKAGPRALMASLRNASEALARGELVCIFAEGGITRTGFIQPFQRGLEQVLKRCPAPVIPVYFDGLWGSVHSFQGKRFYWKWPGRFPYPVWVNFGKPLPPTVTAGEVRQAVQLLSAESAVRRMPSRLPVHRQFVRMATRHPFRLCFVDGHDPVRTPLRYIEALVGAKLLRRHLRRLLKHDPMVGLWLPPSSGAALANIALAFLGKPTVNLNYTSSAEMVQSAIGQCGIRHILTSRQFTARSALNPGPGVELIYLEDIRAKITRLQRMGTLFASLVIPRFIQERWLLRLGRHTSTDLATVIFSSGSTGEPKGVMLTHGNIAANAASMIQAIDPLPRDRLLGILPFFHSFGYTVTLWVPLQVGAALILYPNPLAAREVGEVCKKHRVTIALATPTFLRSYLKRCEPDEFQTLRLLICGAEKMPQPLVKEFEAKFGVLPLEGYGCTELSPVVSTNVPDQEIADGYRQIANKPGTIGLPIPGVALRVVHRETMEPLPMGTEGLLLVHGANVMKGYLGRDDLTRKKIVNGWYITGDLARMDEDGFTTITGREERFAKVGGEMVPLEKVEEEIHHALATNERAVVVTAIPDERKGERLIVLHLSLNGLDVEQIRHQLGSRGLPNICIPSARDFFAVEDIPVLGSGKLDLKRCKQKALELAHRA